MRINVNAFIAVVLCTALLGGLWLLNTRNVLDDGVWNPHDMYNSVGGSKYSQLNMSSERPSSGTALSLSPSRTLSRKASSVPYHLMASSPNNLITSSPHSPITSSPISYASSAAQFHSFGGGSDMMGGVAGGSFRANPEAMPSAASLSMPSMPNYAMVARGQNAEVLQGEMAAVSAISSMANAYNMPMRSSITSIGDQLYRIGASDLTFGYGQRSFGINNQKRIGGIADNYIGWLSTPEMWEEALGSDFSGYSNGAEGLTMEQIRALYVACTGDLNFDNEESWNAFWAWLNMQQADDGFKWKLLPLGDAVPFVLLLCLLYACVVCYKVRKQESI